MGTLSGYWKAKFAEHGTISNSNQIDTSATGYQSLASVNAVFSQAGGYATPTPQTPTLGRPGFIQDLGATSLVNPLGASGLSYCQCVATMVTGCGANQAQLAALPTGAGNAATNMYKTAATGGLTLKIAGADLGLVLTGSVTLNDLSEEYNSLSLYIQEAIGDKPSSFAAENPFGSTSTFNKQGDIDAVNAILGSLGKLDKCASMAFDHIA